MRVAARSLTPVVGVVALGSLVLAGCGTDNGAYCEIVGDAGAVENWNPDKPAEVRERLDEVIEVAPSDIKPVWEEFAAGFEQLAQGELDLQEVEDTTSELHETAQQIDQDAAQRCAG